MGEIVEQAHAEWCCEETDRPHVHVGEQDGQAFFRLGHTEFRGPTLEAVMEAADRWLEGQR
jgi:hypothetical protein